MLGGGFQSFVAWRYLMERRPPIHWLMLSLLLGIEVIAACGFGLAEGLALANMQWKATGTGEEMRLAFTMPMHPAVGGGFLVAIVLAIPATWKHGAPWVAAGVAAIGGFLLGLIAPASMALFGLKLPWLVAAMAVAMPLVVLLMYALVGSRAIGALIIASIFAGLVLYLVGWGLEHYWVTHNPGRPPYNKMVKAMSNLHRYDRIGCWILIAAGLFFTLSGTLLVTIARGVRLAHWRSVLGWGWVVGGVVIASVATLLLKNVPAEDTVSEFARLFGTQCLGPLALLIPLGVFRYWFTFFTTVSMSGVFVGSMALVVVLSVMSGFESDLRVKILGSNAHIRVTKEEGMISDWREVLERVRAVPGVRGVTPYATTEVVLSANQNYATVVIKGIDPETVGDVTELFDDIEGDPEDKKRAVANLYPLAEDPLDNEVPDDAGAAPDDAFDQAPDDLTTGGDPIDFSGEDEEEDASVEPPPDPESDPAPPDFALEDTDEPDVIDYGDDNEIDLEDLIEGDRLGDNDFLDEPPEGGRLALLDGVLVGKELVKQLHLFAGQEVRLVSPLADPANPDATGTPIPFHRDYRIAGIFYTGMYEYDLKFVYVPLESLQDFIQIGDDIDGIEIRVADPDATEGVRAAIARELGPGYVVQDWKELNRNLFSALKLEKIAMFLVLAIIILVASFSIVGNLIMVVVEKGKEIALLKTLGASNVGVMRVFVMQGFFIGLVGTMTGVLEGLAICLACKVLGFPINADVYYISTLPIHIEPFSVGAIAAAGLVISGFATVYPAWMAARLRPAEGLRHD